MSDPLYLWSASQKKWLKIEQKKKFYDRADIAELERIILLQEHYLSNTEDPTARKYLIGTILKLKKAVKRKKRK